MMAESAFERKRAKMMSSGGDQRSTGGNGDDDFVDESTEPIAAAGAGGHMIDGAGNYDPSLIDRALIADPSMLNDAQNGGLSAINQAQVIDQSQIDDAGIDDGQRSIDRIDGGGDQSEAVDISEDGIDRTKEYANGPLIQHCQGAEARLYRSVFLGRPVMVKERFAKAYRHPDLDQQIRRDHLRAEIRAIVKCQRAGIPVPPICFVDPDKNRLVLGLIDESITVRGYIQEIQEGLKEDEAERNRRFAELADEIGRLIARIHEIDVIHGDLTTSNILVRRHRAEIDASTGERNRLVLIDFGLSYEKRLAEDKGVDLYVLEKAFLSTHPDTEAVFERILFTYGQTYTNGGKKALAKLADVRLRGRKREMIG